jgi:hypothetical protein
MLSNRQLRAGPSGLVPQHKQTAPGSKRRLQRAAAGSVGCGVLHGPWRHERGHFRRAGEQCAWVHAQCPWPCPLSKLKKVNAAAAEAGTLYMHQAVLLVGFSREQVATFRSMMDGMEVSNCRQGDADTGAEHPSWSLATTADCLALHLAGRLRAGHTSEHSNVGRHTGGSSLGSATALSAGAFHVYDSTLICICSTDRLCQSAGNCRR